MFYFTYVLLSKQDSNLYVGHTSDLEKRLEQHHRGGVTATKTRRPLMLIYYEACLSERDAIKREKYFKTGFGRRFMKNRLENFSQEIQARDGGLGKEGQKVVVEKKGREIVIKDWRK